MIAIDVFAAALTGTVIVLTARSATTLGIRHAAGDRHAVISFVLLPDAARGDLDVEVADSKNAKWSKHFPVPSVGN